MTDEEREALIERYLGNKLSAGERAAFEIRMLEDPALLEQVQLADAFKSALVQEKSSLTALNSTGNTNVLPFRAWLRQPLSLAASVLVAAFGLQMVFSNSGAGPVPTGMAVGSVLLLEGTRGAAPLAFNGQAPYLFQIDAGFGNVAASFNVTLRDATAVVFAQSGLRADTDGWVRLLFTAPLSGEYVVELAWADAQGQQQTRSFPVQVAPTGQ